MNRKFLLVTMALTLLLIVAACGGKTEAPADNSATGGAEANGQSLVIQASNYKFDQQEYRVKKGEPVTISLKNNSGMHGIEISNLDIKVTQNKSETVTINDAGQYEIHCNIPCGTGHAEMKATLIVE
ncbi:cupredoxin domain-containing protein [Paenibacillus sp. SYP-B4298]|uniref:cupredoxin domain-containing protein n=1 Tax=Paenibacillus sp. SYP-B4298 TaxID=2996034 RepID=UPI0022DCFEE0|nr:cupredoxin domain-containing protein [Paenibacillus sp. SYP-B4298]